MQNFEQTIIHQYATSEKLIALIESFNSAIDPTVNFNEFLDNVWNINTAKGYGLDIWGRIVGVARSLNIPKSRTDLFSYAPTGANYANGTYYRQINQKSFFGYSPNSKNYFDGNYAQAEDLEVFENIGESTYYLNDNVYRLLVIAKSIANISDSSPKTINKILNTIFDNADGRAWVQDLGNMTMMYNFEYDLDAVSSAIVTQSGVLPSPCGVKKYAMIGKIAKKFNYGSASNSALQEPIYLLNGTKFLINSDKYLINGYKEIEVSSSTGNYYDCNYYDYNQLVRIK